MTSDVAAVLELEARRCSFLTSGNVEAIEALLDRELTYVHSTGVVHDRAQWLDFLRTAARFDSVERRNLRGRQLPGLVMVTGLMRIQGKRVHTGKAFGSTSFVSQLWRLVEDGSWRLRLFQSTKVDEALWA